MNLYSTTFPIDSLPTGSGPTPFQTQTPTTQSPTTTQTVPSLSNETNQNPLDLTSLSRELESSSYSLATIVSISVAAIFLILLIISIVIIVFLVKKNRDLKRTYKSKSSNHENLSNGSAKRVNQSPKSEVPNKVSNTENLAVQLTELDSSHRSVKPLLAQGVGKQEGIFSLSVFVLHNLSQTHK